MHTSRIPPCGRESGAVGCLEDYESSNVGYVEGLGFVLQDGDCCKIRVVPRVKSSMETTSLRSGMVSMELGTVLGPFCVFRFIGYVVKSEIWDWTLEFWALGDYGIFWIG